MKLAALCLLAVAGYALYRSLFAVDRSLDKTIMAAGLQ